MSNPASFAQIDGQYRYRTDPAPAIDMDKFAPLQRLLNSLDANMSQQTEAIKAFGLPADLPATTHGRTTITAPVVLPIEHRNSLRIYGHSRLPPLRRS